ncbi:hypothetical protein LCGC14_0347550 [marine sediment metagenome]|uniref:Uncharacterized protein n=1 Tax=marine sediment metagenome TaxID=412755 RepID=A0A0F9WJN9_9ZZZZ
MTSTMTTTATRIEQPWQRVLLRNQLHNDSARWLDAAQERLDSSTQVLKDSIREAYEEYAALEDPEFALSTFSCWLARVLKLEDPLEIYCQTKTWRGWWGPKFVAQKTILRLKVY